MLLKQSEQASAPFAPFRQRSGFALIATITMLALLALIAIGFLSLSAVQVRSSSQSRYDLEAKANARLAMMLALGELQKQLGPDQRVSAPASILDANPATLEVEGVAHPHWTGAWSSQYKDGESIWLRDDSRGGLQDRRITEGWDRKRESLSYLVSGNEGGRALNSGFLDAAAATGELEDSVELVGKGSLGDDAERLRDGAVVAKRVPVRTGRQSGNYAYWVGDLGTRANIATRNAHAGAAGSNAISRLYEVMAAQEAKSDLMTNGGGSGLTVEEDLKAALVTAGEVDLLNSDSAEWRRSHFHDMTVHSKSLLTNTKDGGLKRDLTAYFESDGAIAGLGTKWTPGLQDSDRLVGPPNEGLAQERGLDWDETRHRFTSPRYGLLRNWSRLGGNIPVGSSEVGAILPKPEPSPRDVELDGMALGNSTPTSIASMDTPNLAPILVEGSMFTEVSYHRNPAGAAHPYNVRLHTFPRVVLWNPYNVALTLDETMVLLHINGRKEMWTDGILQQGPWQFNVRAQWIWFVGGRSNEFNPAEEGILQSQLYRDPYIGSFYYSLKKTTFEPGECLVFAPDQAAEYNQLGLENNTLGPQYAPDADLSYYFTASELDGGMDFYPTTYWFEKTTYWNIRNQSDDFRMMLKSRGTERGITPEKYDDLPQISFVSCSMQYGAGREPRLSWNRLNRQDMYQTDLATARWIPKEGQAAKPVPNVRTRDGYRLRWFEEHLSNLTNSGDLTGEPHFETAHLANWNPRGAYSFRTPWDNLAGSVARDGSGSGPWFFGLYTRDLFDQAVSWNDMMPVPRNGKMTGNPFGQPIEGKGRYVLFDVPRRETGVLSLGQLQHAKLSEFVWHPTYTVGQSLVDPRVGMETTAPLFAGTAAKIDGGWDPNSIGWSNDGERSSDREAWAQFGRALAQNYAESDHLVYDLSYEVNHSLWDDFFLSTGDYRQKGKFLEDGQDHPLPNGRHVLSRSTRDLVSEDRLGDFHRAAYHLVVDGGFNVNSTSVAAWKAVLAATRDSQVGAKDRTPFPRVLDAPDGEWIDGNVDDASAWAGFRSLSDEDLERLALEIVREVKTRGPFLSLSDFVNRRLVDDETGRMGPLQSAIEAANLNGAFIGGEPLRNQDPLKDYQHPDNVDDPTRLEQILKPESKAWGAPGYLTQGDLLQVLGPALTARSDTFVIRAYGDAVDGVGAVVARAWCEVVVQRTPIPVHPTTIGLNSVRGGQGNDFGRRFAIRSFRWLNADEI